jgi:hypothetical protein
MTRDNGDPAGNALVRAIRTGDLSSSQPLLTTHPGLASARSAPQGRDNVRPFEPAR